MLKKRYYHNIIVNTLFHMCAHTNFLHVAVPSEVPTLILDCSVMSRDLVQVTVTSSPSSTQSSGTVQVMTVPFENIVVCGIICVTNSHCLVSY